MPFEKTITLYTYDELSESAKEKARSWWLGCLDSTDFTWVIEDFCEVIGRMGFDPIIRGGTSNEPSIYWSLGYSQSDYAGFEARYRYAKGGATAVKAYAPTDEALHAIAESLQEMQKRNFWQITATVKHDDRRGFDITEVMKNGSDAYWHDSEDDPHYVIREACKDLAHWLYTQLRNHDEHLTSEESVADAMQANGYTFRQDGTRED